MSKKLVKIMSLMLAIVCIIATLSACGNNSDTDISDNSGIASTTDNTENTNQKQETGTVKIIDASYNDSSTGQDVVNIIKINYDIPENYKVKEHMSRDSFDSPLPFGIVNTANIGSTDKNYYEIGITSSESIGIGTLTFHKKGYYDNFETLESEYSFREDYTSATGVKYKVYTKSRERSSYVFTDYRILADIGSQNVAVMFSINDYVTGKYITADDGSTVLDNDVSEKFFTIIDAFNFSLGEVEGDTVNFSKYVGQTKTDSEEIKNKIISAYTKTDSAE